MSTIINATTTNGVVIQPDNSGSLALQTNSGTTAVTIDTSQNVGIGTTSPANFLDISKIQNAETNIGLSNTSTGADAQVRTKYTTNSGLFTVGTTGTAHPYGGDAYIYQVANKGIRFATNDTERMRIDSSGNLLFNSGYGSVATAYGCRAWVNFNGTGTVAIRASANVTSITDNGVGAYTVNLTNAMPDANYSVSSIADDDSGNNASIITYRSATTSTILIGVWKSAFGRADPSIVAVSIFR